ncbi:hypothetical protein MFIFM68171_11136 [Madurella fahalii]|uniref:Uncharacterized protein n=1 Tax=Madurella fahalii TaxID=1157608 RepID=A0ABQ0GT66_9PEZI
MLPLTIITLLLASLGIARGLAVDRGSLASYEARNGRGKKKPKPSATCIAPDALQTGSLYTGLEEGTVGIRPGLSESATDEANFVNFCAGRTLTNGQQNRNGSCNGIPMGRIPSANNMISMIITSPQPGDRFKPMTTFFVKIQTRNLRAGFLANPSTNYYSAPQDLDENGDVIGHVHVTIQEIGSLKALVAPDPTQFAFFKGVDDAGDGKGALKAEVSGGLPVGVYRVCTMVAARNHQPPIMPIAQRGPQDDCTKFEVGA